MAVKNRADLQISIDSNLPDNTTEAITPATHRAVEEDLKDSNYNLLDNQATDVNYTPTTGTDWVDPDPTEVGGALDDLAGRVTTIEGQGFQTAVQTPYTRTVPSDWDGTPNELQSSTDELAARMRIIETNNFSDSVAYVSKQGDDLTAELGNQAKPFLTIQAAANAINTSDSILKVLGGGTYSEAVVLQANSLNCIYDFGQCTINGRLTFINSFAGTNNCIIKDLNLITTGLDNQIESEFLINLNVTGSSKISLKTTTSLNCSFVTSNTTATVDGSNNTYQNCKIQNTSSGRALYRSPGSVLYDTFLQSSTGITISSQPTEDTPGELIKLYNCQAKGTNIVISGENQAANLMAYNSKFYSATSNVIEQGGTFYGTYLNFQGCEFYTKGTLNVLKMGGSINRVLGRNYTFKDCLFHTETGFPIEEPVSYNGSDAGVTILINCIYTATQATSAAPQVGKIVEHNSYSYPNYTDFNNLQ